MTQSDTQEKKQTRPRILKGVVVSDAMDKTVVVKVDGYVKHAKYKKYYKTSKKYKAHDEKNAVSVGDVVSIKEIPPMSRDKKFIVIDTK